MNIRCQLFEYTGKKTDWVENPNHPGSKCRDQIFRNVATGEEMTHDALPVGAMIFSDDEHDKKGPDGRSLFVKTPGGWWNVDMRASNCAKPDDVQHNCWSRHGVAPNITVDKVGSHCSAGAGSIAIGTYHGFLINGELTEC